MRYFAIRQYFTTKTMIYLEWFSTIESICLGTFRSIECRLEDYKSRFIHNELTKIDILSPDISQWKMLHFRARITEPKISR